MNKKVIIVIIVVILVLAGTSYYVGLSEERKRVAPELEKLKKIDSIINFNSIQWESYMVGVVKEVVDRNLTITGFEEREKEITVSIRADSHIFRVSYFKQEEGFPEGFSEEDIVGEPYIMDGVTYLSAEKEVSFEDIKTGDEVFVRFDLKPDYTLEGNLVKVREKGSSPIEF